MGLKYSVTYVVNRCAVIQALLFHLQSVGIKRFSIIPKGVWIFGMVNKHCFHLKVTTCTVLTPKKTVSLSSEALNLGTDFLSLDMKVLDGIFFQQKAILSTLKI